MSEKDHSVKEIVKKIAARIRKDLFQYRTALFAVAVYFLFMHVGCNAGCPSVCLTGFPCPACGLTRAARLLFCAKFVEAYRMNPMIYPMILFLCAFFLSLYSWKKTAACGSMGCSSPYCMYCNLYLPDADTISGRSSDGILSRESFVQNIGQNI